LYAATGRLAARVDFLRNDRAVVHELAARIDEIDFATGLDRASRSDGSTVLNHSGVGTDAQFDRREVGVSKSTSVGQHHATAGRKRDRTAVGRDHSVVDHVAANERRAAAAGLDFSVVDYARRRVAAKVEYSAFQKFVVWNVEHRGGKTIGVDHAAGANEDAARVDEQHVAVRVKRAKDCRRVVRRDDAIKNRRRSARLQKVCRVSLRNRKALPVDDRPVGQRSNVGRRPVDGNVRNTSRHLTAGQLGERVIGWQQGEKNSNADEYQWQLSD